jgi:hypothetical protein
MEAALGASRMAGMGDPMGWVPWGRDFLIADPNLRAAVHAYRHDRFARELLERGGQIHGYGLADVRAVLGEGAVEVVDPVLAGVPGSGRDEPPPSIFGALGGLGGMGQRRFSGSGGLSSSPAPPPRRRRIA